ncbi:hypothetical protein ACP4OV_015042 [Aristida adscensionis]
MLLVVESNCGLLGALVCFTEEWFSDSHNQAMRFGDVDVVKLSVLVMSMSVLMRAELTNEDEDACPLPSDLLWREPFFDQLIANRYKPVGICAHVVLLRFDDGITIVSLESACVMHFSQAEPRGAIFDTLKQGHNAATKVPVYLNPGSLVLEQYGKTSITLRKQYIFLEFCPSGPLSLLRND